jgi:hypothetical protein
MEDHDRIVIEYRRYYSSVVTQQTKESPHGIRQKSTRSTKLHVVTMINICFNVIMLLLLLFQTARDQISFTSRIILAVSFISLIFDNAVVALGAYIGTSRTLKLLSKLRCGLHAIGMPILFVPITEACTRSNMISHNSGNITTFVSFILAAHEAIVWYKYDIHDLVLMDRRESDVHIGLSFAGSLSYTSGRGFKAVAPAILLNLYALLVGMYLLWGGFGGEYLFMCALITFLSNAFNDPYAQMLGETVLLGGILRTLILL